MNEQLVLLPHPSVAVKTTVVVPIGNVLPLATLAVIVVPPQLSETVGMAHEYVGCELEIVALEGQLVIVGACVSTSVIR